MPAPLLTQDNFQKGFLIDEELMAGVSENPDKPGEFMAFLVEHASGSVVAVEKFATLDAALQLVNHMPRDWAFESPGGCGGGKCGTGECGNGGCGGGCKSGSCS